jgi:hypothetical protein
MAFFQPAGDYFRREIMLGYRQGAAQFGGPPTGSEFPWALAAFREIPHRVRQ